MLEPLSADDETSQILSAFEQCDFDSNTLQTGQAIALNVSRVNADFRINERVFREKLAARPDLALSLQEKQEEDKEAIGNGKMA